LEPCLAFEGFVAFNLQFRATSWPLLTILGCCLGCCAQGPS
jgi:hypothetical protein